MNHERTKNILATGFIICALLLGELIGVPFTHLNKAQEITTYILIIAAVLWVFEWVPLFVVSFLILALEIVWLLPELKLLDLANKANVFYSAFFSNIILLFMGGFVLSSLMQKYGLDVKFAQAILARTKGHADTTLLGIIIACSFLSMWISNTATCAMMLAIVFPLIKRIPEAHPFRTALVLSIPFACNIGGIGTPIGTPPNAIALSYLTQQGFEIHFTQWMALTLPYMLLFLFILWRLLLFCFPARNLHLSTEEHPKDTFTIKHWTAIGIFIATALGWFFGQALGLKTGTVALLPIICAFWWRLLDSNDFRKLPWDILYIISGGMALGIALELSGLGSLLVAQLPTDASPMFLLVLAAFVAGMMSTLMSNTATAGLIIPLVMQLDVANHLLLSIVLILALMCSMAMALPITTPPNAIAFSSRAIRGKDMLIAGGAMTLIGFVILAATGPWYWRWVIANLS